MGPAEAAGAPRGVGEGDAAGLKAAAATVNGSGAT